MRQTVTFALLVLAFTMPAFAKQSKTQQVGEMTLTSEDAKNLFKTPGHSPYAGRNFPTSVYWGDTHLHTSNSLDGRAFGVTASTELFRNGFHPADAFNALWPLKDTSAARFRLTDTSPAQFGDVEDRQAASTAPPTIRVSQALSSAPPSEMIEEDQIAEALANPLSYLWLMFTQNDTIWYDGDIADKLGEDARVQNTYLIQPVLSIQLTQNWKTIIRPVIPIHSFETVGNVDVTTTTPSAVRGVDFKRKTGLGDIVLWTAFSNQYTPPFVWGFGPTLMLNTATHDQLGTGKFSAGPMALGVSITEKWIWGGPSTGGPSLGRTRSR